jgi:hypothetical protein
MENHDYVEFLVKLKDKVCEFESKWQLYNKNTAVPLNDMMELGLRVSYIGKLNRLKKAKLFSVEEIKQLYRLISSRDEQTRKLGMGIIDGRIPARKKSKKVL